MEVSHLEIFNRPQAIEYWNILGSICFSKQIFYRKQSLGAPDYWPLNGGWLLNRWPLNGDLKLYTEWDYIIKPCMRKLVKGLRGNPT